MNSVSYPNIKVQHDFVLLGESLLEELDKVLENELTRLSAHREETIDTEIRAKRREYLAERAANAPSDDSNARALRAIDAEVRGWWDRQHSCSTRIELLLHNKRKIQGATVRELLVHPELENTYPVGLKATLVCGKIEGGIDISPEFFDPPIRMTVTPPTSDQARQLLMALEIWADKLRRPWHVNWWGNTHALLLWLEVFFLGLLVLLGIWIWMVAKPKPPNPHLVRAHELLQKGIGAEDLPEAIRLVLALQSGYSEPAKVVPIDDSSGWVSWVMWGSLIVGLVLLSVKPVKHVIALGPLGRKRFSSWETYIRWLFILLPGFVLVNIVLPLIQAWLQKRLGIS